MPNWTDDQDAELRRLVAEGYSAKQIGEATGRSRNAVIGRCWRRGYKLMGQQMIRPPEPPVQPRHRKAQPLLVPVRQPKRIDPAIAAAIALLRASGGEWRPLPGTVPVNAFAVSGCRWPVGRVAGKTLFCDAPQTDAGRDWQRAYCPIHAALAVGVARHRWRRAVGNAKRVAA